MKLRVISIIVLLFVVNIVWVGCGKKDKNGAAVIGIVQPVEDETLDAARKGFIEALDKNGYSEKTGTVKFIYRNAQNDQPTLGQILDYFMSEKVDAIGANATLSMQVAASKTTTIPIFVMVAPAPRLIDLVRTKDGKEYVQDNLSGVYDTLTYIDRNLQVAREVFPSIKRIGVIFNSSEPNSQNAMRRLRNAASESGFEIVERAVTNSNDVQQTLEAVLSENIELFFALPDNTIFATFETIYKATMNKKIPILTSEVGLVKRGASIASGPDMYLWGYEAGEMCASYLKTKTIPKIHSVSNQSRRKMYNKRSAELLNIQVPSNYQEVISVDRTAK